MSDYPIVTRGCSETGHTLFWMRVKRAVVYFLGRVEGLRRRIKARVLDNTRNFMVKLGNESEDGALVVVEGPRDVQALRSLGFKGKTHMLCWNSGLSKLPAEMLKFRKVIPLLDLDREGKALTKRIIGAAERNGVKIDMYYWRQIIPVTEGSITEIQELIKFSDGNPSSTM